MKESGKWTVAVDGTPWPEKFGMVWDPVFSPEGKHVLAKAWRDDSYMLVVDGKITGPAYENLFDFVFSDDGTKLLIKCVENGLCFRKVIFSKDLT